MPIDSRQLVQRFDALSTREKWLVVSAFVLVIWAIWDNLIHQPMQRQKIEASNAVQSLQENLNNQRRLAAQIQQVSQQDGSRQTLDGVRQSVNHLKQQLYAGEKKFVPPDKMAQALQDILRQNGNLRLVGMETLPVKPFGGESQETAWVYRHSLSLVVQGDFFSTLDYLKSLENLPWRVHWEAIDYKVTAYPNAETRLQVYTLSFEKDWLGA